MELVRAGGWGSGGYRGDGAGLVRDRTLRSLWALRVGHCEI